MHLDIIHLMTFYDQPLGRIISPIINSKIQDLWPTLSDRRLLGLGYSIPYLQFFQRSAERVLACMPAAQGVTNWPKECSNLTCLSEDYDLPFEDSSIDNVLIVHGIEMTRDPDSMLREVWRILAPAGRLIVIAANRSGFWARTESSPFGYGHPYSRGQLRSLLSSCDFQTVSSETILHVPPSNNKVMLHFARFLETLGGKICPGIGGLVLVEAQKIQLDEIPVKKVKKRHAKVLKPAFATGQSVGLSGIEGKLPVHRKDSRSTMAC